MYTTPLSYFEPYVCSFHSNTHEINLSSFPLSIDKSAFAVLSFKKIRSEKKKRKKKPHGTGEIRMSELLPTKKFS